jgi:signal transduction histidine kinase
MITERSNLWVGLAKETAHQLGTPISSLMGWVEYMKTIRDADDEIDPEIFINQIQDICDDMHKDLTRLQKITSRFSQIGSKPALKINNINEIIEENMKYFRTRLPLLGKRIEIRNYPCTDPNVPLNKDLIEWVLENLFKNAIDAIKKNEGIIEIKTEYIECDNILRIQHIDNGRGISWDEQKNVFTPGYTTKIRGWGLGLTLAKRIVEDYHHGRIYVSWSQRNKGTAINIDLPVNRAVN